MNGDDANRVIDFNSFHKLSSHLYGLLDFDEILVETGIETGLGVNKLYVTPNYFGKLPLKFSASTLGDQQRHRPAETQNAWPCSDELEREYGASFLNSPRYIAQIGRDRVAAIAQGHTR